MSSLNSNPIIVTADADISTGWRASQTLNTGSIPGYTAKRQPGIHPVKILVEAAATTTVNGTINVTDPTDNTVLWTVSINGATTHQVGDILTREDFEEHFPAWRDFTVTGPTATATKLYIWYRN